MDIKVSFCEQYLYILGKSSLTFFYRKRKKNVFWKVQVRFGTNGKYKSWVVSLLSSLSCIISLSFCLFSYSGVYYYGLKLSAIDVIVYQKSSNGDRKLQKMSVQVDIY